MISLINKKVLKTNESGFTFIELLVAAVMSVLVLGLLAHMFRSQQKSFTTQNELNKMQANGRAGTEFLARSVQNAGFNVIRGTRFLSASDHYFTAVYDENNDNVIQNNEVITYTIANVYDGSDDDNFSFKAFFDVDGDGAVENGENPTVTIKMTTAETPFNLYKVTPTSDGSDITRSLVARDIDNMLIRYYDRYGKLLPQGIDADDDGVPDSGNWTYTLPATELNNIRKVEIDVLGRSRNEDPRDGFYDSGTYPQGSLAAVVSGGTSYSDHYHRETFTAQSSPRNLVMAPWGNVDVQANPETVSCPGTSSVTVTLLDVNGEPIDGEPVNFTATGSGVTLSPTSGTSDTHGQATTTVSYDYAYPFVTSTVSGSAFVDDGNGNKNPIYNAVPVGFAFGGQGFIDHFDGSLLQPWAPLVPGGSNFVVDTEMFKSSQAGPSVHVGSINGCSNWQNYVVQTNFKTNATMPNNEYAGIILRSVDQNNYFWVRIARLGGYELQIGKREAGADTVLATDSTISFNDFEDYTIKVQVKGNEIKSKYWEPADPADPAADEPNAWGIEVTDNTFNNGKFGLEASHDIFLFDDVVVENAEKDI